MKNKENTRQKLFLLLCIIGCEAAGGIGAVFTTPKIDTWYRTLEKPFFNPPDWIFFPVWTVLYALLGVVLFLLFRAHQKKPSKTTQLALTLFFVQLVMNTAWSILFFGLEQLFVSAIEIIVFWVVTLVLCIISFRLDRRVSYLLFPYLAWVAFAAALNWSIWFLNRCGCSV